MTNFYKAKHGSPRNNCKATGRTKLYGNQLTSNFEKEMVTVGRKFNQSSYGQLNVRKSGFGNQYKSNAGLKANKFGSS